VGVEEHLPDSARALPTGFRRLLLAWAGSQTGDGLRMIALPLLAVRINPSPAAVALVAVASTLPWLVVAIPAGALVDRLNPARVMATAHLTRAALSLAVVANVVTGTVSIPLLCVIGFAITSAETFADGSAQTLLLQIVPHGQLERANARFVTAETLALDMVGPLAAGFLFVLATWLPFAASAGCFLFATVTVAPLASTRPVGRGCTAGSDPLADSGPGAPALGALASIRIGLQRLAGDPVLRTLVITVGVMAIAVTAIDAVLVLYGTQTLEMSEAWYPTLLVSYSCGTLLAAAFVGRVIARLRGGQAMMIALFGISAAMIILGLVPVIAVALLAFGLMGVGGGTWNVLSATRRQRRTPPDMIGRVSSAFRVVAWGVLPIGALLGGAIGQRWGVPSVFLVAGLMVAVLGVIVVRSFMRVEPDPHGEPAA